MAITTIDQVVAALSSGQKFPLNKQNQTSEGAGNFHNLFRAGALPAGGALPPTGVGAVPTNATLGAIPFTNPTGGNKSYLLKWAMQGVTAGTIILYDRLWHNSGLSGTQVVSANINSVALTRPDALGANVEPWVEWYVAIGATAATLSVTYTNQDGVGSKVATYAHPANAETAWQMAPMVLAAGDTGVRTIDSYVWSVTTGTAGSFGITLLRRIAEIPLTLANVGVVLDYALLGMPEILDDACLAMMVQCTATNTGQMLGSLIIGQG